LQGEAADGGGRCNVLRHARLTTEVMTMGFSSDPHMVRVDFFKTSGKWYATEAVRWVQYSVRDDGGNVVLIHDVFLKSLAEHLQKHSFDDTDHCRHCGVAAGDMSATDHCQKAPYQLPGMMAVCLEPYHEHAFPLMVIVPGSST